MSRVFDLFGDPVPVGRGKAGRPEHVPTNENRNKIMMLLAIGRDVDQVSKAIGVSKPTLRKHYFSELKSVDAARFRLEAAMLTVLAREAEAGSVAAVKELDRLMERERRRQIEQMLDANRDEPIGKKHAAVRAAQGAGIGTEWGDDLTGRSLQ